MIPMEFPRGGVRQMPVKAIYADKTVTSLAHLIPWLTTSGAIRTSPT